MFRTVIEVELKTLLSSAMAAKITSVIITILWGLQYTVGTSRQYQSLVLELGDFQEQKEARSIYLYHELYLMRHASTSHPPLDNGLKNSGEGCIIKVNNVEQIKVTKISWCHRVPATSWWSHGCNELDIQKCSVTVFFSVIPTTSKPPLC